MPFIPVSYAIPAVSILPLLGKKTLGATIEGESEEAEDGKSVEDH